VEIGGIVRAVTPGTTALDIQVASGGNRIHIFSQAANGRRSPKPHRRAGAREGVVAASFNREAALRHLCPW